MKRPLPDPHLFDTRAARCYIAAFVRWWSAFSCENVDATGNPVQFRDGPAAVTEENRKAI